MKLVPPAGLNTLPEPIFDAEVVEFRLRDAGAVLLALPGRGCFPAGYRIAWPQDVVRAATAAEHNDDKMIETPTPRRVDQMDEAFRWLTLLPADKVEHRRIVLLRSLVSPRHGRNIHSWRKIGEMLSLEHRTVQARYAQAIGWITAELYRQQLGGAAWAVTWERMRQVAGSLNTRALIPDEPKPVLPKPPTAWEPSSLERAAGIAKFIQVMPGRSRAALSHFPGDGSPRSAQGGRGFGEREIISLQVAGFLEPGPAEGHWRLTGDGAQARGMLPGANIAVAA